MLGEYPDDLAFDARPFVENIGCDALDGIPQRQELRLPCDALRALYASEFVHGGITDLALDRIGVVQHGEPERQAFVVVS